MRTVLLPIVLVLIGGVTGCVSESRPEACEDASVTIELELRDGDLVSDDPAVCRDQEVTLVVTADGEGTFHIHGYDHAVAATEFSADEPLELAFVADTAGQFTIEIHSDEQPAGTSIGIFTVHEP